MHCISQVPDYNTCCALTRLLNEHSVKEWLPAFFERAEVIVSNNDRTIMRVHSAGGTFILKCSEDEVQMKNEMCVSQNCLNETRLWCSQIPWNYATWRMGRSFYSLQEYIAGKTFYQYLTGEKVQCTKIIELLLKIIGLVQELNRRHRFVHWDLAPHNIILNDRRGPVIIDFGRSRLTLDDGKIIASSPQYVSLNECQDVQHLLITTLYHIVRRRDAGSLTRCTAWIHNAVCIWPTKCTEDLIQKTEKAAKFDRLINMFVLRESTSSRLGESNEKKGSRGVIEGTKNYWKSPVLLPRSVQEKVLQGHGVMESLSSLMWPRATLTESRRSALPERGKLPTPPRDIAELYDLWDDKKKWREKLEQVENLDPEIKYLQSLK